MTKSTLDPVNLAHLDEGNHSFSEDEKWMKRALEEGEKGLGLTSPNPAVGAVIVKNGVEIGAGWHKKAGLAHAEREAFADAVEKYGAEAIQGATIYVTLEPCSTKGRTAACTDGILDYGVAKVVYGAVDPNPEHAGAADSLLREKGVEVVSGVLEAECERLLRSFTKRISTGMPWVVAKTAMSLDGRITRPPQEGQWLTGEKSRALVHQLRATVDAILVGGTTVRRDNPRLTLRGVPVEEGKLQPWRVVLTQTGKGSFDCDSHLFSDNYKDRTLVFENESLEDVLKNLAKKGCNRVMLECGGQLMRQFASAGLIDEYMIFFAPMITGGDDFGFGLGEHFAHSIQLKEISYTTFGDDVLVRGIV